MPRSRRRPACPSRAAVGEPQFEGPVLARYCPLDRRPEQGERGRPGRAGVAFDVPPLPVGPAVGEIAKAEARTVAGSAELEAELVVDPDLRDPVPPQPVEN